MRGRLRQSFSVLSPALIIPIAVYALLVFWGLFLDPRGEGAEFLGLARSGLVMVTVVIHGLLRAAQFHPTLRGDYGAWLRTTPWRHPAPLPLGPVALGLADGFVFLVGAALLWLEGLCPPMWAIIAGSFAHQLALAPVLSVRGGAAGGLHALALPVVVLVWRDPVAALVAVLVLDGLARVALRRSLIAFREQADPELDIRWLQAVAPAGRLWHRMRFEQAASDLSFGAAFVASAVAGWLLYVALSATGWQPFDSDGRSLLFNLVVPVLAALRVSVYLGEHFAPISLWGRIRAGRLVLPGFDVIFVGPALAVLAAVVIPPRLLAVGLSPTVAAAVGFASVLLVLLGAPPSQRRWTLTGDHRLALEPSWLERIQLNNTVSNNTVRS